MSQTSSMKKQPNILFIMSDDHASHAISSYSNILNSTPQIDRIAKEGMRFDNCFCTNSICTPSRAVILTGKYSHVNGVKTLFDKMDGRQPTVSKLLQRAGYQTAIVGKWHLGHGGNYDPAGFDYWNVLHNQGEYHHPAFVEMGKRKSYSGYVTDIIADLSLEWLKRRDRDRPFFLMCHHKAPHRPWEPDTKHQMMYEDIDIPEPATLHDDYSHRSNAAASAKMRIDEDLTLRDLKASPPPGLTQRETRSWNYQRFMKDYLRCIASVDDNVGRMLDYLDEDGLTEDTLVIYTSDQGFFLGDHGWYDKRLMYEESLRMPLLIRYPREILPGSVQQAMALNVDFAETFLEYAGVPVPEEMQGNSLRTLCRGEVPDGWQTSMYYRYWEHMSEGHRVGAHYGIRTSRYKLIHYYGEGLGVDHRGASEKTAQEWELFDLNHDPHEQRNVYDDPSYADTVRHLTQELRRLQHQVGDILVQPTAHTHADRPE